jgi:hypothetical protein
VSRAARTRARVKDLDQIQDDMKPKNRLNYEAQPIDEDKPGLGQHVSRTEGDVARSWSLDSRLQLRAASHGSLQRCANDTQYCVECAK